MLSASRKKSATTAKKTIKMCKVLETKNVHCGGRQMPLRAFMPLFLFRSAPIRANTKQTKTNMLRRFKRRDYSISNRHVNQTMPSLLHEILLFTFVSRASGFNGNRIYLLAPNSLMACRTGEKSLTSSKGFFFSPNLSIRLSISTSVICPSGVMALSSRS